MDIWFGINKSGKLSMHYVEPHRSGDRWISNRPYVNSAIYKDIENVISKSEMTWNDDPECININFK